MVYGHQQKMPHAMKCPQKVPKGMDDPRILDAEIEIEILSTLRGCPFVITILSLDTDTRYKPAVPLLIMPLAVYGSLRGFSFSDEDTNETGNEEDNITFEIRLLILILDVALQVAYGLSFAHSKGVIHADVKPDNVLL